MTDPTRKPPASRVDGALAKAVAKATAKPKATAPATTAPVTDGSPPSPDHPDGADSSPPPVTTDGRQLRRELYRDGNLQPSSEEIAERSGLSPRSLFRYFDDVEDLVRAAIGRQQGRAIPLIPIDADPDAPFEVKVTALVEQRFRLFEAVGNAAGVLRLRSPFQPLLAAALARNRAFLRWQLRTLLAPELARLGAAADGALAAADVVTSFESRHLLLDDQGLTRTQAMAVMVDSLLAILRSSP
jgi:AcrR family transcriptional regulator